MTFRQITIQTTNGAVELTGEVVTEHFALVPGVHSSPDGDHRLTGGATLTHIPSGRFIHGPWWTESLEAKRTLAETLEAAAVDWVNFAPSKENSEAIQAAYRRAKQITADDENSPGLTIHV
ncbi:hypothetical protein [Tsukamurella sp. USMM236]|uniref:hypothetical protein n=1 Tax=Tsukamurella sp. USMM236 TaxID=3081301 RepID=UPI00301AF8B0